MNEKSPPKQKIIFVLTLFALLFGGKFLGHAQSGSGISLSWNVGVGCQTYSEDRKKVFLEEIADSECINVCQGSSVIYTLNGLPPLSTTVWTISGGTIAAQSNSSLTINWAQIGDAEISFVITTPTGLLTNKLCLKVVQGPKAQFFAAPFTIEDHEIKVCSNQLVYFTNASQTNGGTAIVNYLWDFGDGSTSDAQNPSHTFTNPGSYEVTLTVTNACNCSSSRAIKVYVDRRGFEITCASVVCERQTTTYSLPPEATQLCGGFKWSVIGGTIIGPDYKPTVDVRWDHVDASGFGYVTFYPDSCELECRIPTTIRVPVIMATGTITGATSLCLGSQGRYSLPQWPTTNFQWEILGNTGGQLGSIIQTDQRNEIIFTPAQSGTFTLVSTYRNTLVHCGGRASITIIVSQPEPFTGASAICVGGSATYNTVSTNPVTWTLRNSNGTVVNTLPSSNNFSYTFNTAGNFTLTVSGPGICAGQTKNIIVVPALAAPTIAAPILIVCPNAPYTYAVANPVPNSEYEWQITNGTITSSTTGPEVNLTFMGSGQIRVRRVQLSPSGCSSPFAVVNVNAVTINADISNTTSVVTQMSACSNNYFTYNAVNTTGGIYVDPDGASTFEWSINPPTAGSITSGQGTATVEVLWNNVANPQLFDLELVIKKCTVISSLSREVEVSPTPSISIANNPTVCSGNQMLFTVNSTIPLIGATILWDFGNGQTETGAQGIYWIQHPFQNGSGANIGYTVTATIIDANNCAGTLTASSNYVVNPGPNASASYNTGGNTFCSQNQINATFAASVTPGASIVWYYGSNLTNATQVGTGASLNVTFANGFNFGSYFFVATLNECSTKSNNLHIVQDCGSLPPCSINPNPNLTFIATNSCGTVTLTGTASGNPTSRRFSIFGPDISLNSVPGNNGANQYVLVTDKAGIYNVFYKATYVSTTGALCTVSEPLVVTVPYVADFKIDASCNTVNNVDNYTVNLTNYSNFLATVTNPQFKYERVTSTGSLIALLSNWSNNQNITNLSLAPGVHYFRQSIRGMVNGVMQTICTKEQSINLTSMNDFSIDFEPPLCFDTAVGFEVPLTDNLGYTFLWTFETLGGVPVTNTNPKPSRVFDESLASSPVIVTLILKNKYGCQRTLSAPFTLPNKCFSGTIASNPSDATVCKESALELYYSPGNLPTECTNSLTYQWLNNNVAIVGATSSTYMANAPGFYTLKVSNGNCEYTSPNVISPTFIPLPSLTLSGPTTLCEGEDAGLSVSTNASVIEWTMNSAVIGTQEFISLPNLPVGFHTVTVKVTENGCEKTASQTFEVVPAPAQVTVSAPVLLDCQSYTVKLIAAASGSGNYNWSNGATDSSIIVNQGGAYSVTFTNAGGCSTSAQVYVPRSPQAYMWVFPEGCYSKCKDEAAYLLGPTFPFFSWSWLLDQQVLSYGMNSVPANLPLQNSGTYNLQLNSGLCDFTSPSMNLTASDNCPDCELIVKIKKISLNPGGICSYTVILDIEHNSGPAFQAALVSNNANLIITPGGFTIQPGTNTYSFNVIPINGFTGGNISLSILGTLIKDDREIKCATSLFLELPQCSTGEARPDNSADTKMVQPIVGNITLYPNPAADKVNIRFETPPGDNQIEIYDLTGRLISSFINKDNQGVYELDLAPMETGVYIVLLRQGGAVLMQRKLQVL
jgi:PKD repeat protein